MKISRSAIVKILWPERGSLFAIVGGAIGLSGDITSFFSEFLSPYYLLAATWIEDSDPIEKAPEIFIEAAVESVVETPAPQAVFLPARTLQPSLSAADHSFRSAYIDGYGTVVE